MNFFHQIIWKATISTIKKINNSKWDSWINNFEMDICYNDNYTFEMYVNYLNFCKQINRNPNHFFRAYCNIHMHKLSTDKLITFYEAAKKNCFHDYFLEYLIISDRIDCLIAILKYDLLMQESIFLKIIKMSLEPNGIWLNRYFYKFQEFDLFSIMLTLS